MGMGGYEAHLRFMKSCMKDSAHDVGHIMRVLEAALVLSLEEKNVDHNVLITAVLLHDIGREEQFRTGESHASVGAWMAEEYLAGRSENENFVSHVCACIRTHSFRKNDPPASVEARLLYDADKLDVVGAIGIARTFLYQGRMKEPVYSVGPDGEVLSGEEKIPSFYSEYTNKLSRLGSRFLTEGGKQTAKSRSDTAARFDAALRTEVAEAESGPGWKILPKSATAEQRRTFNLAVMLSDGSASQEELAVAVMKDERPAGGSAVERFVMDALALQSEGALGIAGRLMGIGAVRGSMLSVLDERPKPCFHTSAAWRLAEQRRETEDMYLAAVHREDIEFKVQAEKIFAGTIR